MARRGQVWRIDKITPFKSGTKLSALCVYFIYIADLIGLEFQLCGQKCFNVKSVLIVRIGSVLEIWVLGDVVLIRKERPHTAQLEDALAAIHNGKLVLTYQLFPQFLKLSEWEVSRPRLSPVLYVSMVSFPNTAANSLRVVGSLPPRKMEVSMLPIMVSALSL